MRFVRMGTFAIIACLALTCAGCAGGESTPVDEVDTAEERTEETSASLGEVPAEDAGDDSGIAEWIAGSWTVEFVLTSVEPDADWSRQAAGQSAATWSCEVEGSEMVLDAGQHVYTGLLTVDGDEWNYDAVSTYVDEGGISWTSHIVVDGVREGDDTFLAEQWGEISSDAEGVLYVATWDCSGTRAGE